MSETYLLLGHPAAGKLTVATAMSDELRRRGSVAKVVDSHYVNNPIFGVVDKDGIRPIAPEVLALVSDVRRAILTAIEHHAAPSWHFIFTNAIRGDSSAAVQRAEAYLKRLRQVAQGRGSALRVVVLTCDRESLVERIDSVDRTAAMKLTSRTIIAALATEPPYLPAEGETLIMDTTHEPPEAVAKRILDHAWTVD